VKTKIITAILYAAAALATANWLDYAFASQQPYGYSVLLKLALAGSVAFVIACVAAFLRGWYSKVFGLVAVCLSWLYFAPLAYTLPWSNFVWLIRIHYRGADEVLAICVLAAVTVYSLLLLRPDRTSLAKAS
jgi:hypothetical protein